jgi:hypothetical protein
MQDIESWMKMILLFPKDIDISVTTFRKDDIKGIAPRSL